MTGNSVHIVGGGIIGLCAAWYLKKTGVSVTVIEKNNSTDGTSFGNAGMIVPSHFVPMASPGVIAQGLKWMLNSKSPFYIKPRMNKDLLQWLWYFYRSANKRHVANSIPVLYELNEQSKGLYKSLATEVGFEFGFKENGLLMLYKTKEQAEEEEILAEKAYKLGVEAEILDSHGLKTLEPEMDLDVLGGLYFPGDAHLYPNQLMNQLVVQLKELGVDFLTHTAIVDFKTKGSRIDSLITEKNELVPVENVLVTSGSWTGIILKKLGVKIHLQDGKGYSITLKDPELRPRVPTILSEAKVAITPMGSDLRIGGTLELSGMSKKINRNRVEGIVESTQAYYKNLKIPFSESTKIWTGYRPCAPDGMPYIGQSHSISNLFVGTGHGMMGLSLGAVTGKLLSEIITHQPPIVSTSPFRLDRFS